MADPIPVILCGNFPEVATTVSEGLKPEYEVVYVVLSTAMGKTNIPLLLAGETPQDKDEVGSGNYSKPPAAVVVGGAYEDSHFDEMREAAKSVSNVPWLKVDMSVPRPPLWKDYPEHIVGRIKATLSSLIQGERMGADGVYLH